MKTRGKHNNQPTCEAKQQRAFESNKSWQLKKLPHRLEVLPNNLEHPSFS